MEWLGQAVVAALCGTATKQKCIKFAWKTEEVHFFLNQAKRGSVLCVYVADQSAKSRGDGAIAVEPVVIVESSVGGLPAFFLSCASSAARLYLIPKLSGLQ